VAGKTLQVAKSSPMTQKKALKSAHFVFSALPVGVQTSPTNLLTSIASFDKSSSKCETLFMAVPKRLLKRAVDRNAVKRVCREAWRAKYLINSLDLVRCQQTRSTPKLIKLINLPSFESTKQLKQLIRADIDTLFAKLK
jgi:ribonuclease P protein component